MKSEIVKKLGIQEHWSVLPKSREYLTQYELKSPVELPPRSMQDSFTSAVIPLSTDLAIRDKYVTYVICCKIKATVIQRVLFFSFQIFLDSVRLGRLMEDRFGKFGRNSMKVKQFGCFYFYFNQIL